MLIPDNWICRPIWISCSVRLRDSARWRKAQEQLLSGRHGPALVAYRDLTSRFPAVAELWFELGNAAVGELNFALANQAYRRSAELAPGNTSLLVLIGQQYQGMRQLDDARAAFERAVASDPSSVDARISLAVWFEKERRLEDAWTAVEASLAQHPRDDQARYFRAFLLHRQKKNSEAETALRDLIKDGPQYPYVKYASLHLLGVVLDEFGQYPEAMRWLLEAKAQVRQLTDVALLEREYDKADNQRRESDRQSDARNDSAVARRSSPINQSLPDCFSWRAPSQRHNLAGADFGRASGGTGVR